MFCCKILFLKEINLEILKFNLKFEFRRSSVEKRF